MMVVLLTRCQVVFILTIGPLLSQILDSCRRYSSRKRKSKDAIAKEMHLASEIEQHWYGERSQIDRISRTDKCIILTLLIETQET